MSIENDLFYYLSHYTALKNIVGYGIYPVMAPLIATVPYIVYFKVSGSRQYTHQGYNGIQNPRYQISVYDDSYLDAKNTAEIVKLALEAWSGSNHIQNIQIENDLDLIDEETKLYHVVVDFFITYGE